MQRAFDDAGLPLSQVTFVVFDLETTGGSPAQCEITEIGAVKVRGGECLGTFQTLVNPGVPIPPEIVYLTGITEMMVAPAPPIESVLPTFLEFVGDAVLVGHNVRFDMAFTQTNLARAGYTRLLNRSVDTCALARRLLREEVRDCRLQTLARHFRTATSPNHRALDDAKATTEVFHYLLERAGTLGVLGLDDLLVLPRTAGHPQVAKLKLVERLPREPGVYLFRDHAGRVLYVGKATNLRARVRSYFSSDDRRKIGPLLREMTAIDFRVCANPLEAAVLEVRLIHEHEPRYNRRSKLWRKYAYVKLSLAERFPRLSVVKSAPSGDGNLYIGPLSSTAAAHTVAEAIETVIPLRRCTSRVPRQPNRSPCTPAQLGVATCPCSGQIDEASYRALTEEAALGLTVEPERLLRPLAERIRRLAAAGRFEEAAFTRDRAAALSRSLRRRAQLTELLACRSLEIGIPSAGGVLVEHGRMTAAWGTGNRPPAPLPFNTELTYPPPRHLFDELLVIVSWLDERGHKSDLSSEGRRVQWGSHELPRFEPRPSRVA